VNPAPATTCAACGEVKPCPWRALDGYVCVACLGERAAKCAAERDAARALVANLNEKLDATHTRRCFKCGTTVAPEPCECAQQLTEARALAQAHLDANHGDPDLHANCADCAYTTERIRAGASRALADAAEARHRRAVQSALAILAATHGSLPDGDTVPRAMVDGLVMMVEAALVSALEQSGGVR
jgi:hypothetical protein